MSNVKDRHCVSNVIELTKATRDKQMQMDNNKKSFVTGADVIDLTCEEEQPMDLPMDVDISLERISYFRRKVCHTFRNSRRGTVSVKRLTEMVNTDNDDIFSENKVKAALKQMADVNQVMVSDGLVYLI